MKAPVNVAITGAAGQIGYALAFRAAAGALLGRDTPVNLHLLEITPALPGLNGVVMELNDCAFPTLNKVVATDDAQVAFRDCQVALLVGARPRGPGAHDPTCHMRYSPVIPISGSGCFGAPVAASQRPSGLNATVAWSAGHRSCRASTTGSGVRPRSCRKAARVVS